MKSIYFLVLIICLGLIFSAFSGCEKQPKDAPVNDPIDCNGSQLNLLPDLTSEGRGIAGCLIDGKVWVPYAGIYYGQDPISDSIRVIYNTTRANPPRIVITLVKSFSNECDTVDQRINIATVKAVTGEIREITNSYGCFTDNAKGGSCERDLSSESFIQIIHVNTNSKTISGKFAFNAVNWRGDTIRITEGRFDTKYQDDY